MTEEQAREAQAQAREFPETLKVLARIRDVLAETLFQTAILDSKTREEIYIRVQALDALKQEMAQLLAANDGEKAIREYVESLSKQK